MRFHVIALPHTQPTDEFSHCAYTTKVRGFVTMMRNLGHEVFVYGGEVPHPDATEHVVVITESKRRLLVSPVHYTRTTFDDSHKLWKAFNARVIAGLHERLEPHDFICHIAGRTGLDVYNAFSNHRHVEFGVGYAGVFAPYRVFESYAWMHTMAGYGGGVPPSSLQANGYASAVVPGYLDPLKFPEPLSRLGSHIAKSAQFLLYVGRCNTDKGMDIIESIASHTDLPIRIAGAGDGWPRHPNVTYIGEVTPEVRNQLMRRATAVLVPTKYIEPFGNVAIEAMACGTPVITNDWGAFTETVIQGVTGFRCRTLRDYLRAIKAAPLLDRRAIREHVVRNYSHDVIAKRFEAYFLDLLDLWDEGWFTPSRPADTALDGELLVAEASELFGEERALRRRTELLMHERLHGTKIEPADEVYDPCAETIDGIALMDIGVSE